MNDYLYFLFNSKTSLGNQRGHALWNHSLVVHLEYLKILGAQLYEQSSNQILG